MEAGPLSRTLLSKRASSRGLSLIRCTATIAGVATAAVRKPETGQHSVNALNPGAYAKVRGQSHEAEVFRLSMKA